MTGVLWAITIVVIYALLQLFSIYAPLQLSGIYGLLQSFRLDKSNARSKTQRQN
jgi:hypothetical protein